MCIDEPLDSWKETNNVYLVHESKGIFSICSKPVEIKVFKYFM